MDQTSQYPGTSRALFGCEENHLGGLGFSARPAGKFKVTLVTGRFKRKHEKHPSKLWIRAKEKREGKPSRLFFQRRRNPQERSGFVCGWAEHAALPAPRSLIHTALVTL